MTCPICGQVFSQQPVQAAHLPHFLVCAACGGYIPRSTEQPVYPDTYFVEKGKRGVVGTLVQTGLRFFQYLRYRRVLALLPHPTSRVLDYGCGNGKLVSYLRTKGLQVSGVDPSLSAVTLAQQQGLPVTQQVPAGGQYDVIMLWHSLEHTDTPLDDIERLSRHLSPSGRFLIAVPHGDSYEARIWHGTWFCYDWPFHRVHFTPRSVKSMLAKIGFGIESIDFFNPEYTISSLLQTWLNVFFPKNTLYAMVSHRRQEGGLLRMVGITLLSVVLLFISFIPLLIFFVIALLRRKTAAFIVVATKMDRRGDV